MMNELKITEYESIRVLTTQQLAVAYETEEQIITNNFNRNKDRYIEGKHFICLIGNEKAEFINKNQNDFSSYVRARSIYLWTEKGAFLHAKSLNTDKAWEVYDHLVDTYFTIKKSLSQLEILQQSVEILNYHEEEIKQMEDRIDKLEFDIPLYGSEADEIANHVKRKGVSILGGKKTNAYQDANIRSKVYRDIYNQIKREFGLYDDSGRQKTYKALKRKYITKAHDLVEAYDPPLHLQEMIRDANAQVKLSIA